MLTYASETRAETTYTQQLLRTIEMKTIRAIHGKTLRDKFRSDQLRQLSGIQDIIKWTNVRRKEWDAHVERMEDNRLAKIFFLLSATTRVEFWLSQRFSSILGGPGLVPNI